MERRERRLVKLAVLTTRVLRVLEQPLEQPHLLLTLAREGLDGDLEGVGLEQATSTSEAIWAFWPS